MPTGSVAYDPNNSTQTAFLAALALGEAPASGGYTVGVGGTDLTGAPVDQYGFPQWSGFGNSHAAGEFQFQPATWDALAAQFGLNFSNPADQNQAAWQLAQQTYAQKTGGSLSAALAAGDYTGVQSALATVWPSVTGNGASPGLAAALTGGTGASLSGGANPISADTSAGGSGGIGGMIASALVGGTFVRIGLFVVGGVILMIALWKLLSDNGVLPSPSDTAKAAGHVAAAAVA